MEYREIIHRSQYRHRDVVFNLQVIPWIFAIALALSVTLWFVFGLNYNNDKSSDSIVVKSTIYLVLTFACAFSLLLIVALFLALKRKIYY